MSRISSAMSVLAAHLLSMVLRGNNGPNAKAEVVILTTKSTNSLYSLVYVRKW